MRTQSYAMLIMQTRQFFVKIKATVSFFLSFIVYDMEYWCITYPVDYNYVSRTGRKQETVWRIFSNLFNIANTTALPEYIRQADSLSKFKNWLKIYLGVHTSIEE